MDDAERFSEALVLSRDRMFDIAAILERGEPIPNLSGFLRATAGRIDEVLAGGTYHPLAPPEKDEG